MDGQTDGPTVLCHVWIVLDCLLVRVKFRHHRNIGNDVFCRSKITRDQQTDRQTDRRTDRPTDRSIDRLTTDGPMDGRINAQTRLLLEMRSRMYKESMQHPSSVCFLQNHCTSSSACHGQTVGATRMRLRSSFRFFFLVFECHQILMKISLSIENNKTRRRICSQWQICNGAAKSLQSYPTSERSLNIKKCIRYHNTWLNMHVMDHTKEN